MLNEKSVYIDVELFKLCFCCDFIDTGIIKMSENGIYLDVSFYNLSLNKKYNYTYSLPNPYFDKYLYEVNKKKRLEKLKRILY